MIRNIMSIGVLIDIIKQMTNQLTIGCLLGELAKLPQNLPILFDDGTKPSSFGSYRGYYEQFAVGDWYGERTDLPDNPTVKDFVNMLNQCTGCSFTGYKGGSFYMGDGTKIWHSNYGCASQMAIIGVTLGPEKDKVIVLTKETLN